MLGLKLATDPRWVNLAEISIEDILVDHAYCEQKAATMCISMIVLHYDREEVVKALTPIVAEEWGHFRMVLAELDKRGLSLGPMRKDHYVAELQKLTKKGGSKEQQLVEKLLVAGLIEARSCERFRILSEGISDESLRAFYHKLMVSEAGHYRLFLDLAKHYASEEYVKNRFDELTRDEAGIFDKLELRGDRIH